MALRYYEFTEEQKASASAVIEADSCALLISELKVEMQVQKIGDLFYKHKPTRTLPH
jgi:hypothetical protein